MPPPRRTASPLFLLGAALVLAGLTGGVRAATVSVEPAIGSRSVAATIVGVVFVLLAIRRGDPP